MEIKITGAPKEIADLVKEMQSQPVVNSTITLDGGTVFQDFQKANIEKALDKFARTIASTPNV